MYTFHLKTNKKKSNLIKKSGIILLVTKVCEYYNSFLFITDVVGTFPPQL